MVVMLPELLLATGVPEVNDVLISIGHLHLLEVVDTSHREIVLVLILLLAVADCN